MQDICHYTSRDIGYFPFYFQVNSILCSILGTFIRKLNYGVICQFIRDVLSYLLQGI